MKSTAYKRKISSKEAQEGFIFILKNKLNLFPKLESKFNVKNGDTPREVQVESYPCTCRGPNSPHEHYFIRWEGLKKGDEVEITKDSDIYILNIK